MTASRRGTCGFQRGERPARCGERPDLTPVVDGRRLTCGAPPLRGSGCRPRRPEDYARRFRRGGDLVLSQWQRGDREEQGHGRGQVGHGRAARRLVGRSRRRDRRRRLLRLGLRGRIRLGRRPRGRGIRGQARLGRVERGFSRLDVERRIGRGERRGGRRRRRGPRSRRQGRRSRIGHRRLGDRGFGRRWLGYGRRAGRSGWAFRAGGTAGRGVARGRSRGAATFVRGRIGLRRAVGTSGHGVVRGRRSLGVGTGRAGRSRRTVRGCRGRFHGGLPGAIGRCRRVVRRRRRPGARRVAGRVRGVTGSGRSGSGHLGRPSLRGRRLSRSGRRRRHDRGRRLKEWRRDRQDGARGQQRERVDVALRRGRHTDAEVYRRLGGLVRDADRADRLALGDGSAAPDGDRAEMDERDRIAVGSQDRHDEAAARNAAGEADRAARRGDHALTERAADVDAAVLPAGVRRGGIEDERAQNGPSGRPRPRVRGRRQKEREHKGDQHGTPHRPTSLLSALSTETAR
jgi:hypothetical protein